MKTAVLLAFLMFSVETCVYICVVCKFSCPNNSWTILKSAPLFKREVANECLIICGLTCLLIAQLSIITISICLIVVGVLNGGASDTLQKAINICTECIGLG